MEKRDFEIIKKELPGIKRNVSLKEYTTFRIGDRAQYFFSAKTKKDLINSISASRKFKLPFFVLGGGSNLLVSDKGFKGLVIKIQHSAFNIINSKIIASAGLPLNKLVSASAEKGLAGLEWAAGIPGTVGGAVFGNSGWSGGGKNISSIVEWVEVLETAEFKIKKYPIKDCRFAYRDSVFKRRPGLVILSVCLKLKKGDKKKIRKNIQDILEKRRKKIPPGFSAGSVFKNPKGFFAAELVEKCGLKGKKIGGAEISKKHANFIVNTGRAKADDVKKLMNLAKRKVKNKFGIILKEEIVFL